MNEQFGRKMNRMSGNRKYFWKEVNMMIGGKGGEGVAV